MCSSAEIGMKMIKVLHSELQQNQGGIESFIENVATKMDVNQIECSFLMRGENKKLEENLKGTIYKVPIGLRPYCIFIKELLQKEKFDIVHIHKNSAINILLPIMVKKYSPQSYIIIHSHNTQPAKTCSAPKAILIVMHKINRRWLRHITDAMFACSELSANWMFGEKNYLAGEVLQVRNGIQIDKYIYNPEVRNIIRSNLEISDETILIGNVGRLRKQKNQLFLIDILAEMKRRGIHSKLVICGMGDQEEAIRRRAMKKNVMNDLILTGICHNVNEILQAMDVFVMPSLYEGLTISAVEAQCAGLPCVFSNTLSKETILTNNCAMLSLNDPIEKWSDAIVSASTVPRKDCTDIIRSAGYDNQETARFLQDFYLKVKQKK